MFNLNEYRRQADRIADVLPWVALVAPGVILNKDGSFQRTISFRGPDLESASDSQLVSACARLNNCLKRLGSGWAIYIEARRHTCQAYPDPKQNHFPEPLSLLIDTERREAFSAMETNFESDFFLTFQYLPSPERSQKVKQFFIQSEGEASDHDYHDDQTYFIQMTERLGDMLKDFMYEAEFLTDEQTLKYLHSIVSNRDHPIKPPEIPAYLDAYLADTPLVGGLSPKLGERYLAVLSVLNFPSTTFPTILEQLNHLPLTYRWVTRFIPLDKAEAERELKAYKRRWFAKRKGMLNMLQEVFTKQESQLQDTAAVEKAQDATEALSSLANQYVAYGYYTATVTVTGATEAEAQDALRQVERVINGMGFTTISETVNSVEAWLSSLPGHAYANVRKPLLHSLNLCHLIPLSAVWSGQHEDEHLAAPPWLYAHTHGRTPFRLVNHIGDVGHMLMLGPTGAGKSVLLALLALQFLRYDKAKIFIFDKGGSFLAASRGVSGAYYRLGGEQTELAFQPLAHVDDLAERTWASEWLQGLLANENIVCTPEVKESLWHALNALAQVPQHQRTLTGFCALLQDKALRQTLATYTLEGAYGHLLDADHESLSENRWQCFEMEDLMAAPSVIAPVLSYLFHRLEQQFTGEPALLILDEAWMFLDHSLFASKIRDWLKTLRKKNVSVLFASQSVQDALATDMSATLLESCPSRILLPNDRALEPQVQETYEEIGLTEKQLSILVNAIPKREYYYQSRLGNRLFELSLGPLALAFCAASRKEDQTLVQSLYEQHGSQHFLRAYLDTMNLSWANAVLDDLNEGNHG